MSVHLRCRCGREFSVPYDPRAPLLCPGCQSSEGHTVVRFEQETGPKYTRKDYEGAQPLACPNLRGYADGWIALERDPCPTCNYPDGCRNKGQPFHSTKQLIIVKETEQR